MKTLKKEELEFLIKIHKREHEANIIAFKILNARKKYGYINTIVYVKDDKNNNYAYSIITQGKLLGIQEL